LSRWRRFVIGARTKKSGITTEQRHGLQPSKGTDYKSAPAAIVVKLCELGEAKSAPAAIVVKLCELGEAKSAPAENFHREE
jgi:hypothetical protein